MNSRLRLLLIFVAILAVANFAWWIYGGWGLITVHVDGKPLSQVIKTIERQGGATIRTNMDVSTPVTLHVDRVPLTEAMESLSAVTESGWRLTYVFAQDKGTIVNVLGGVAAGTRPEGWKRVYYPVPPVMEEDDLPSDPRNDIWNVSEPAEKTLQAYLEQAGRSVSASFLVPENWNPAVSKSLSSGKVGKLAPKLAQLAHGQVQEVFLLEQRRRPEGQMAQRGEGGDSPWMGGGEGRREAMEQRILAEIEKLPPEKRAAAKEELAERRQMFASMQDLTPEQRREKMREIFERPDIQERMEERESKRDARRTPEQRLQRFKSYVERKQQIKNGQ